jgi:hypothetical protein
VPQCGPHDLQPPSNPGLWQPAKLTRGE